MIGANAHGCVMCLTDVNQRRHTLPYPLQFVVVLLLGELQLTNISISVITRVNPNFFNQHGSHLGSLGIKMNVSH